MPDGPGRGTVGKLAHDKKVPQKTTSRTTIQIVPVTKLKMDHIKEKEDLGTYDEVINFLIGERRKHLSSTAGSTPDTTQFEREEKDDPYRQLR
ncbi:MAG: hypothetical protein PHF57_12925 [Methanoregula sp.]|nr:hypothetical protein [Methanoregula sp.]MDD5025207.1 hypothetical protein [Methanoregula sp.]MDD5189101.1 hypothetical protein [Methanoregula sp.]